MTKKFQPLVTCIVPMYNSERYITKGIESLLSQTYPSLEIILIDDHSSDKTWSICSKYAEKYENITLIRTKENSGGPFTGRLLGIEHAQGEWITFMDHDDYVRRDYIKNLVAATEFGKYDIAVTGHSRLYTNGRIVNFIWEDYSQSTNDRLRVFHEHFMLGQFNTDPTDTIGQSIVRADICKHTRFDNVPADIYAEDTVMALGFLANSSNGVNFVDNHDFIWRQVPGSGSNGGFYKRANRDAFYEYCMSVFTRKNIQPILNQEAGKVSIIVPAYNIEGYIKECLDSILQQTYRNIEVIVVDDKSPDTSGDIADHYAKLDDRVKVIHKNENSGLNMARAAGFEMSTGAYIMFVDGDDLIAMDCVEFAIKMNIVHKTDFVKFNAIIFKNRASLPRRLLSIDEQNKEVVISGKRELFRTRFTDQIVGLSRVTVWGGLYSRRAVEGVEWQKSNYRQYEDNFWTLQLLNGVDAGTYSSRAGYFYRHDDSYSGVLSKALSGNSINGRPIGYMEFVKEYTDTLRGYNKKYKLNLNDEIEKFEAWMWIDRLTKILEGNMLGKENNSKYLSEAINSLVTRNRNDADKVHALEEELKKAYEVNGTLVADNKNTHREIRELRNELRSHMSVRRSTRLLLGNIKRRTRAGKK